MCVPLSDHPLLRSFFPNIQGFVVNPRKEVVAGEGDFRYSIPALRDALELEGTFS